MKVTGTIDLKEYDTLEPIISLVDMGITELELAPVGSTITFIRSS